jgi:cytoskeletal protein RodZ
MRISGSLACWGAMVVLFGSGAAAQGKGAPKPKVTSAAPAQTKTSAPKSHATGPVKTADTAKSNGHAKTVTTTTTPATTPTGPALTPVQQKLQRNTNLAAKLQSRLPATTDLNTAAAGFRNLGQFVAAVNVSNNLGLDFPTLKTAMVVDGKSLGQAIQAQKSTVDGSTVAARAEHDADTMIRSTEQSSKTPKAKTKSDGGRP